MSSPSVWLAIRAAQTASRSPLRLSIESYRYNGPHRNWNPNTRRVERGFVHYDWRWKIRLRGKTLQSRQSFCSYSSARSSAERAYTYWTEIIKGREGSSL